VTDCSCRCHNGFLTAKGLKETGKAEKQYSLEALRLFARPDIVDKIVSVSALIEPPEPIFVDSVIEEQMRRAG